MGRTATARGRAAEAWVAERLIEDGWTVLDRNWRGADGELDLVVERGDQLRFVEVKAREPGDPSGLESVDDRKQARLRGAAEAWLAGRTRRGELCFLVALVTLDPLGWSVEWWDDAFDG